MNAPTRQDLIHWTEANRSYLHAEVRRMRACLGDGDRAVAETDVAAAAAQLPAPAAIDVLCDLFRLSPFERDIVLLLAGAEMDGRIAQLSGGRISFATALAVLKDPHWTALAPTEPLRRWQIVLIEGAGGLSSAALRIDERILHYLAGVNYVDPHLAAILRPVLPPALVDAAHQAAADTALEEMSAQRRDATDVLVLDGRDRDGQCDVAALVAGALGLSLFTIAGRDIPLDSVDRDRLATLLGREARLAALGYLIEAEAEQGATIAGFLHRFHDFVALSGAGAEAAADGHRALRLRIDLPDAAGQHRLWDRALGPDAAAALTRRLSRRYRLSARRIAATAERIRTDGDAEALADLGAALRGDAAGLGGLAQEIPPRACRSDLVLPAPQLRILQQIVTHVRLRAQVQDEWGFGAKSGRGLGVATLFWGDSGTGKTLAAEVLAAELGLPLYRIDLSAVVSKYIGETEKNLARVFDAAEAGGAILLFDEADALFGKRSEVRDSHDRYANIEVSYLLQRMEAYGGLAVLTTNHKSALDAAFLRRLRFVVNFPFPDAALRDAIWRATVPDRTPVEGLDFAALSNLAVAGGTIRNIALNAAFLAAEAGTPLTMAHLLRAAHMDATKRETALSSAETRGWA